MHVGCAGPLGDLRPTHHPERNRGWTPCSVRPGAPVPLRRQAPLVPEPSGASQGMRAISPRALWRVATLALLFAGAARAQEAGPGGTYRPIGIGLPPLPPEPAGRR